MPRKRKETEPVEELRVMHLMDCDPYMREKPNQPVVVIRLAHRDEIEKPMMLSMWDAGRLAKLIYIALATHGDQDAFKVLELLGSQQKPGPEWIESGDPSVKG